MVTALKEFQSGSMGRFGGFFDITYNHKSGVMYISSDTLYQRSQSSFSIFTSSNTGRQISFPVNIKSFANGITL